MKKVSLIVISILLASLLMLSVACAPAPAPQPSPTQAPAPKPSPTAAPSPQPAVIELKMADFQIEQTPHTQQALIPWIKAIGERTNGRVKVTLYPNETLVKAAETFDAVVKGTIDIGAGYAGHTPGRFPLTAVTQLPLPIDSASTVSRVTWDIYQKYGKSEWKDVKVLWVHASGPAQLQSKKPFLTLDDLKGKRLRTPGGYGSKLLQAMGAIPVNVTGPESYLALQRGDVDCILIGYSAVISFRLQEIVTDVTRINLNYAGPWYVVMNQAKYNSLPPDIQKVIDDLSGEQWSLASGKAWDAAEAPGLKLLEDAKVKFHDMAPAELQKLKDFSQVVYDGWVKEMTDKGLPGKDVLNDAIALSEKYKK